MDQNRYNSIYLHRPDRIVFLLLISIFHFVCENGMVNHSPASITIVPEYIQAKTAWLYISVETDFSNTDVLIHQDAKQIDRFRMQKNDSLYQVADLEVQTSYTFKAILDIEDKLEFSSPEIKITTLDTTRRITGWDEYVLGDFGAGIFRDIEAISDEEVWAVGYVTDFSSSTPGRNGAKWNGSGWDLLEIPVLGYDPGSVDSTYDTVNLMNVLGSNENDIWFTAGGVVFNYNGIKYGKYTFLFQSLDDPDFGLVEEASLIAPNNIWATGQKGAVYHYDGNTWQQIASPTRADLTTITGYASPEGDQVWIGGMNILYYKNNDGEWQKIMDGDPESIGFKTANIRVLRQYDEHNMYMAIFGQRGTERFQGYIFRINPKHPDRMILLASIPHWYNDMHVISANEIYLAGTDGGSITHFDGHTFTLYSSSDSGDWFYGISSSENFIFLSGQRGQRGLILRGHKF